MGAVRLKTVICPYCGRQAEYVDSSIIYGLSYGMIYLCRPCDAYVGVHKGTDRPLGRLADNELRRWKKEAHVNFDRLWKHGNMTRGEAYVWLSRQMDIPVSETHIGMFDVAQCKQVVSIMLNYVRRKLP
jgi:hypothetical protein